MTEAYYAQYVKASRSHWWFRARNRILTRLVRAVLSDVHGRRIVDVGSGPGGPARTLFPSGWLIALDRELQPLHAYPQADGRVVGDAERLPCGEGSVDVLCAFEVLEHLNDDRGALQGWRRALQPGGWLVLTVPAYQALWSRHDRVNAHRRRYRASQLRRLLAETGFAVARLTYFNTLLLPGVAAVRWAERLWDGLTPWKRDDRLVGRGELDFQKRLPQWLERWCERLFSLEAVWLKHHSFPAGVSIGVVARRMGRTD